MIRNPSLLVQIENGYYDLATPFFAMEWTTDHMNVPAELRGNIRHRYYQAGHMMYVLDEELMSLRTNVLDLINDAAAMTQ